MDMIIGALVFVVGFFCGAIVMKAGMEANERNQK